MTKRVSVNFKVVGVRHVHGELLAGGFTEVFFYQARSSNISWNDEGLIINQRPSPKPRRPLQLHDFC